MNILKVWRLIIPQGPRLSVLCRGNRICQLFRKVSNDMKSKKLIVIVAVILVVGFFGYITFWSTGHESEEHDHSEHVTTTS